MFSNFPLIEHDFGFKRSVFTLLGISQELFLWVFNIFCMVVIDYEWLRLIQSVFNFHPYWVYFGVKRSNFHCFGLISGTVSAIFLVFSMIIIDQERFRLISSIFKFDPYWVWL